MKKRLLFFIVIALLFTTTFASSQESSQENTIGFTGQDYFESVDLVLFPARAYSPSHGRFLQRDPSGYVDGENLYEYVSGDPLGSVDELGLQGGAGFIDDAAKGAIKMDKAIKTLDGNIKLTFGKGLTDKFLPAGNLVGGLARNVEIGNSVIFSKLPPNNNIDNIVELTISLGARRVSGVSLVEPKIPIRPWYGSEIQAGVNLITWFHKNRAKKLPPKLSLTKKEMRDIYDKIEKLREKQQSLNDKAEELLDSLNKNIRLRARKKSILELLTGKGPRSLSRYYKDAIIDVKKGELYTYHPLRFHPNTGDFLTFGWEFEQFPEATLIIKHGPTQVIEEIRTERGNAPGPFIQKLWQDVIVDFNNLNRPGIGTDFP